MRKRCLMKFPCTALRVELPNTLWLPLGKALSIAISLELTLNWRGKPFFSGLLMDIMFCSGSTSVHSSLQASPARHHVSLITCRKAAIFLLQPPIKVSISFSRGIHGSFCWCLDHLLKLMCLGSLMPFSLQNPLYACAALLLEPSHHSFSKSWRVWRSNRLAWLIALNTDSGSRRFAPRFISSCRTPSRRRMVFGLSPLNIIFAS